MNLVVVKMVGSDEPGDLFPVGSCSVSQPARPGTDFVDARPTTEDAADSVAFLPEPVAP